ncbi:MAG: hypothetical protein N4A76_11475 [Firmicutes bacterium]|jgi:hypothetical protein|nr:hypothetical protein [Bacillota bacterium]
MYKISDVSKMLGVEGYKIIELMVNEREKLKDHIKYVQGVRQIDQDGIDLIRKFLNDDISQEISDDSDNKESKYSNDLDSTDIIMDDDKEKEIDDDYNRDGIVENIKRDETVNLQINEKSKEEIITEEEEDILGKYKKEIYVLDQEIRRLDYAISSYFDIISEDMSWLQDEEKNLLEKYKVLSEIIKEENNKGLLKGIFRR